MLFNSFQFIFIFLPLTFIGYFYFNLKKKTTLARFYLVIASVVFYAWWEYKNVLLLFSSIGFNYIISGLIVKARELRIKNDSLHNDSTLIESHSITPPQCI
ncbi:hypothetical protein CQA53_06425 [Helicobacter didelphidarum]|uniref:MBOAT family protein n=1 Tax=Helicobacter didelphidarum TaxID=2040648 RepID=A0A3D8IJB2_9HELI|nr:hypothetical protein [Helicobacter didelphidarum]RDU65309.1 hypothetical protein CQA53_06425 [Helicobacter didelphidarum]